MINNIGCRIYTQINRSDKTLIERFRNLPVANIGDNMNRLYCVDSGIKNINGKEMLGTAFTLHVPSGDNLFFHKALDMASPGDVLVVASGTMERSYCGELMMMCARNRGLAGFAIDGYIRDLEEVLKMDFSVFARGVTPQGPYKFGPGEINVPIAFGGQVVFPGDIVIGDKDGIIFVRPSEAEEILKNSWLQNEKENLLRMRYEKGDAVSSYNKELMDNTLDAINCQFVEGNWHKDK